MCGFDSYSCMLSCSLLICSSACTTCATDHMPCRMQARFDATTTNHDMYHAHDVQPRERHGPKYEARPNVPFDATTTNHVRRYSCEQRVSLLRGSEL
jgi:hypothetical protein